MFFSTSNRSLLLLPILLASTMPVPLRLAAHPSVDEQLSQLDQVETQRRCDGAAELKRGDLHRSRQDWAHARAAYDKAAACDPQLDEVDFARGLLELESGNTPDALPYFNRYLGKHPDSPQALLSRGRARAKLERSVDAIADFDRAIELLRDPQPDHYIERARAEVGAGRNRDAVIGLDRGIARLGPVPALQRLAIDIEVADQRFDVALQRVDAAVAGGVNREAWMVRRGDILEAAGRPSEARQAFGVALATIASRPEQQRQAAALQELEEHSREALKRLAEKLPPAR
ncbi:MAG: tetratricopeptide repeat protein [Deltaproteobacteria bacterium]|nr:tetratricopeptide repeat protein [Deltaproteobacteria bacterium]